MNAVVAVEGLVERRVDDVEARNPDPSEGGEPQCRRGLAQVGMGRGVSGQRRQRERQADAEVAQRGEPLEIGIRGEHRERHPRHAEVPRTERRAGRQIRKTGGEEQRPGFHQLHSPCGKLARSGARIERVEPAVYQPIDGERRGPRADDRHQDQGPARPR